MSGPVRRKFSSRLAPDVLAAFGRIAQTQGRELQTVLDEALRDSIDKQHQPGRPYVGLAFAASLKEFDGLYRALAQ